MVGVTVTVTVTVEMRRKDADVVQNPPTVPTMLWREAMQYDAAMV